MSYSILEEFFSGTKQSLQGNNIDIEAWDLLKDRMQGISYDFFNGPVDNNAIQDDQASGSAGGMARGTSGLLRIADDPNMPTQDFVLAPKCLRA